MHMMQRHFLAFYLDSKEHDVAPLNVFSLLFVTHHSCKVNIHSVIFLFVQMLCIQYEPKGLQVTTIIILCTLIK